jgi:hypothetical protein
VDALGDGAHPGRIAYNGNEVQFEWELRPVADQEKKANGASLDASPFRLRSHRPCVERSAIDIA